MYWVRRGNRLKHQRTQQLTRQANETWVELSWRSVTVRLYKDGIASNETVDFDQTNNWAATFSGLLRNDATDGHVIAYTVVEENVPAGYTQCSLAIQIEVDAATTRDSTKHSSYHASNTPTTHHQHPTCNPPIVRLQPKKKQLKASWRLATSPRLLCCSSYRQRYYHRLALL